MLDVATVVDPTLDRDVEARVMSLITGRVLTGTW
jgi:hypothetical protein